MHHSPLPPAGPPAVLPQAPVVPAWPDPTRDAAAPAPQASVLRRLSQQWQKPWAARGVTLGAVLALLGFVAALGWGAPVLDHPADGRLLAGGVAAALLGGWMLSRGWSATGRAGKRAVVAVTVVIAFAFGMGVMTNPVVVDGRVFLSTSREAKQFRMMTDIHDDLLRLRSLDVYLTYSPADAGAHYNEYAPALAELTAMTNRYAGYTDRSLPDPRFAETVAAVKSSAYWAGKAMDAKIQLLNQEDARYADNVATFRANFAQQYVAAGRALSFLSADLNIPLNQREHE